jgi:hypothetical protein
MGSQEISTVAETTAAVIFGTKSMMAQWRDLTGMAMVLLPAESGRRETMEVTETSHLGTCPKVTASETKCLLEDSTEALQEVAGLSPEGDSGNAEATIEAQVATEMKRNKEY